MDTDDFIKDFEQQMEWFCDKIGEPVPHHPKDKDRIYERMATVGWVRQVEVDTYKELTKEPDE